MKIKKVILAILILFPIILIIIGNYFYSKYSSPKKIVSSDNSFSIIIPGKISFKEFSSDDTNYILDVYSLKDEMILFTTKFEINNFSLSSIVESEKMNLIKTIPTAKNISDISSIELENLEAYKYSYIYTDEKSNNDFYSEVLWIKGNNNIYAIDFEVILDNMDKYIPIFNDIELSFNEF